MISPLKLQKKLTSVWPLLDERSRRLLAANEAMSLGYGGISAVHQACGLSRQSIANGICEVEEGATTLPVLCPSKFEVRHPPMSQFHLGRS
jgi:hypothetical protein